MITSVDDKSRLRRATPGLSEPNESDLLTSLLEPCRFMSRCARPWKPPAPWGYDVPQSPPGFILVLEGSCLLELANDGGSWTLEADDIAILTRAMDVCLRDRQGSPTHPLRRLIELDGETEWRQRGAGGTIGATRFVCGELDCEDDYSRQTFGLLPPVVVLRGNAGDAAGWFRPLVEALLKEIDQPQPGGDLLCNRILQILLIQALRQTSVRLPDAAGGLLTALRIPGLGTAMGAMHARPDHDWSVHELAEIAGLSRAAFAARFLEVVGEPPFHYLRDVRMRLSCRLLCETEKGIKEIAARAGYSTEASFSKAFTRWCGQAPGEYRRKIRATESASRRPAAQNGAAR
ncbi:MAG TPA: AraC family transcriptional regulator [Planctomycetaceae bacterium]|nr:AraC family transcriptional regulator [Planctomycetaceae bacterium]